MDGKRAVWYGRHVCDRCGAEGDTYAFERDGAIADEMPRVSIAVYCLACLTHREPEITVAMEPALVPGPRPVSDLQ